ncbi:hypothetical protein H6P81_015054 [Aristolochia fimbriata]|uniref:B-block binding subunit of TFIIIC domain-containing protein n=1 Tax=Aristolochia fimbriata TaxID=158543 RepID=A0AAV7E579_ARIFI|nr:hypothetical protein H6P81_015054 [Aristolochia fimbriata]
MDVVVAEALNEVCARKCDGLTLNDLWPLLRKPLCSFGLHLCDGVKQSVWNGLLNVPALRFEAHGSVLSPRDPSIQSVEKSEKSGLKMVAADHLIDSSLGLYDLKYSDAELSAQQRQTLEQLAVARTNGITQSELAKGFGISGNSMFFVVKYLECQGLLVRRSTTVRTKESDADGNNGNKTTPIVHTNLLYLYRYGKHLNMSPQQRLEITRLDILGSGNNANQTPIGGDAIACEAIKEDVLVRDFLPSMIAVCDKLETSGKVLVVSDIKKDLGYRGTAGHRAWRNICKRLKEAGCIEEFKAEVNKKVVNCLRLLKKFEPSCENDDFDPDQPTQYAKRGQITEQVVELPVDQQIYNMIEAAGPHGILVPEVCQRLGLNSKRNHRRITSLFSRFGVQQQPESLKKCVCYRATTRGNSAANQEVNGEDQLPLDSTRNLLPHGQSLPSSPNMCPMKSTDEFGSYKVGSDVQNEGLLQCHEDHLVQDPEVVSPEVYVKQDMQIKVAETGVDLPAKSSGLSATVNFQRGSRRYACLTLTATNIQREQRILKRLQHEKFALAAELYRWLENFEKDKPTTMARKTLTRHLQKLQSEGHCKCILINIPNVSNCGRYRPFEVVLNPSVRCLSPELLGQIHERARQFEMQSRGHGVSRLSNDQVLPVLTDVKRSGGRVDSDGQAARIEAMRANGYVPAKMVRSKLLHTFLWDHLSRSPEWADVLSPESDGDDLKQPRRTCRLFAMDEALKAMPLELFLQVAGSAQKIDDLVENCRLGLCLSNLTAQEYTQLMDTQATARLSWIINILCRLKLIQLCEKEQVEMREMVSSAVLTYALDLKPYIEEPLLRGLPLSSVNFSDLRPRVRHDFFLSNRDVVDAYWKTLEYCYSAADPIAASHAFPGSSVREIYFCRSWSSERVMTAEQRAELLKRVGNGDQERKISFKECDKIARDLNLSLEQVLRVCNDRRRSRTSALKKKNREIDHATKDLESAACRKKKSLDQISPNDVKLDSVMKECVSPARSLPSSDEMKSLDLENCHHPVTEDQEHDEDEVDSGDEDGRENFFINQCAFERIKPSRRSKFIWTDNSDRILVMQYARHRAALGLKFHRVDWASVSDLPAPTDTCRRRISALKSDSNVRRAILNLCNVLGERYAEHLSLHEKERADDRAVENSVTDILGSEWDDFEDPTIKMALEEVLLCKQTAKTESSKRVGLRQEKEWPYFPLTAEMSSSHNQDANKENEPTLSSNCVKRQKRESTVFSLGGKSKTKRLRRLPGKFLKLLHNEGPGVCHKAYDSLAVANAVELLKVVFLSNSSAPEVPKLLLETLRHYPEADLFAAFNYLRGKNFMIDGQGSQPFVLSKRFWHNASSSPFPINTGKRAANFANWLHRCEKDLMEDGAKLSEDLQCGDIFHLFASVSLGELSIAPCLPNEGVGEAEEQKGMKRKSDATELSILELAKKQKSHWQIDGEFGSRREKGFPGIILSISCAALSKTQAADLFLRDETDQDISSSEFLRLGSPSCSENLNASNISAHGVQVVSHSASLWEHIMTYVEISVSSHERQGISLCPESFTTVYSIICEAGQQGLSLEEISTLKVVQGYKPAEIIVEALQVFGLVIKVNAFDCMRVVDTSYKPMYFLSSCPYRYINTPTHVKHRGMERIPLSIAQHDDRKENSLLKEASVNICDGHKITLINVPEEDCQPCREPQSAGEAIRFEDYTQDKASPSEPMTTETCITPNGSHTSCPILPWLNGDGSTNTIVYRGFVRRILGTVMQNPGMLEEDLTRRMDVLNPQTCRKLLDLMILDNHLIVRKMHQKISSGPPALLDAGKRRQDFVHRRHLFANPMSTFLL